MGSELILLSGKVKRNWKIAFSSVIVIGLIAHLYKFMNYLPNHDALFFVSTNANGLASGRWFLNAACILSSSFDLPWLTGVLALLWVGLTAVIIADIYQIENPFVLFLTGGLLVSFPCITNTFFYEFTADGYMLAMLLAAAAVRFSLIGDRKLSHTLISVLCICVSCGIYQAYVSFALLLAVCYFVWIILSQTCELKQMYRWIGRQVMIYVAGLGLYWLIWKICLAATHTITNDYQGIAAGASFSGASFLAGFRKMCSTLIRFFFSRNVLQYGWTVYAILNLFFLAFTIVVLGIAIKKRLLLKQPQKLLLLIISLVLLPAFSCIWYFLSADVDYHMLMLQSLCNLYLLTMFMTDRFGTRPVKAVASVFFLVLIGKFCVQANECYFEMDECARITQATATEMLSRIHAEDDGSIQKIAFIGGEDSSLVTEGVDGIDEIMVHAHQLHRNLMFNHNYASLYLNNVLHAEYIPVDHKTLKELENAAWADTMAVWPLKGSLRMEGDTVVIKLSNTMECEGKD